MKKIKDNDRKFWALDDLTEKEKKDAIDSGCKPGKKYTGDVDAPEEILFCPHCGSIILEKKRCKHFLFYYDSTNGEYKHINQIFQNYIKRDKTLDFPVDKFPIPKDIVDKIPQVFLAEIHDVSGSHGIICGYGDEKFIRQIKVTKNWSNKYY
jgi:hypothetical protein